MAGLISLCPLLSQGKGGSAIKTECYHQKSLNGMDYQDKHSTVRLTDTIQHQYCLNSKMPRTCSVRRRNQYSKAANHKGNKGCHRTKLGCVLETIEGKVEVQIITYPYTYRIQQEEYGVLYVTDRKETILQVSQIPGSSYWLPQER